VRTDSHKLVRADWENRAVLYDLVKDPRETRDASAEQMPAFRRLSTDLESLRRARRPQLTDKQKAKVLDRATLERLRALGYKQ
jgi:hypothetical protein